MGLLIVFTIAFTLVSLVLTDGRNNIPKTVKTYKATVDVIDKYLSTRLTIDQSEKLANGLWVDMEVEMNESARSRPEFWTKIVQVPFHLKVFGHNVREVEVMREGGIRSAYPDIRWSAMPLRIKTFDKYAPCPIRYRFDDGSLTIQWEFGNHNCINVSKLSFQLKIFANGKNHSIFKKFRSENWKNAPLPDIANNFYVSYQYKVPGLLDTFDLGFQLKINETDIKNNTVISVKHFPLCSNFYTRSSCLFDARLANPPLLCYWCPAIRICSSKRDFLQKVWMDNGCEPKRLIKIFEDISMTSFTF
ncbi:Hypothetical predicted protein [Cloeon dipterum]|uniref:Uncharacterized protein n=1 Tax=Cloeon dipterum TaxID=197152 RepID=A0A8S1DSL4_9INSE|nr:Hypothetical predicted protein [Cloeon dipterum]